MPSLYSGQIPVNPQPGVQVQKKKKRDRVCQREMEEVQCVAHDFNSLIFASS